MKEKIFRTISDSDSRLSAWAMRNAALIFLLTFSFMMKLTAQQAPHINCQSHLLWDDMESHYTGYAEAVNGTFKDAHRAIDGLRSLNTVYTIPVVLHVVWNQAEENIPDSVIQAQLDVVNEELLAEHVDWGNLRDTFGDIGGIPNIQLELVSIERVYTDNVFANDTSLTIDEALKVTENGGSSPWDPDRFLNIWLCKTTSITGAFAYPPVSLMDYPLLDKWGEFLDVLNPIYDGIVMDYRIFGGRDRVVEDEAGLSINFEGRILIHELGHYLGLRHIWGDALPMDFPGWEDIEGCSAEYDDGISDTPDAWFSAIECDPTLDDCMEDELPNMWENYMDYTPEKCMITFTKEQVGLMRAVLEGPRAGLLDFVSSTERTGARDDVVRLWPNPTRGVIHIAVDGFRSESEMRLRVIDGLGRELSQLQYIDTTADQFTFSLPAGETGLFYVEIMAGEARYLKRFIVMPQ